MYLPHIEGLVLIFVIKVIAHTQLGSCPLRQKDNDLLSQPSCHPAHRRHGPFSTKQHLCCCCATAITGTWSYALACSQVRAAPFYEHEHPASIGVGHWVSLLTQTWCLASTQVPAQTWAGSAGSTGEASWAFKANTPPNLSSCLCFLWIWYQELQWNAHGNQSRYCRMHPRPRFSRCSSRACMIRS